MQTIRSHLKDFNLAQQRVFVRADLNVSMNNGQIINDHRLLAILPTIEMIQKKGGIIILATHLGRPQQPTPAASTKILMPWFQKRGFTIAFEPDLVRAAELSRSLSQKGTSEIILLENLRFFPGEHRNNDETFAQLLFQLGDYYVNDAFALLHRNDTSITLLPRLFPKNKKTVGLLVEQECTALDRLRNPQKPFVVICGGGKVQDKLPLLNALLGKATTLLLCPAIVFTFLKAQGISIGASLVDENALDAIQSIISKAQHTGTTLLFPLDYQVALNSLQGDLTEVDALSIPTHSIGLSIGSKTKTLFTQELQHAKTIFFNGLPGLWERPETLEGARVLLSALANSKAFTVIGGGDSVAAAERFGLADKMSYCSTGGGATLAYIAGEPLPGIEAMEISL